MQQQHVLALCGGGIRSLVATALALSAPGVPTAHPTPLPTANPPAPSSSGGAPRLSYLHIKDGRPGGRMRLYFAQRQSTHFHARQFHELDRPGFGGPAATARTAPAVDLAEQAPMLFRPQVLVTALAWAMGLKASAVLWPVQFNADTDACARATEQAVLAQHLAQLEGQQPVPGVLTPVLELTDQQMIEIGAHLSVPWELAWCCLLEGDRPCGVCAGCRRRRAAFEAAGVVDPVEKGSGGAGGGGRVAGGG